MYVGMLSDKDKEIDKQTKIAEAFDKEGAKISKELEEITKKYNEVACSHDVLFEKLVKARNASIQLENAHAEQIQDMVDGANQQKDLIGRMREEINEYRDQQLEMPKMKSDIEQLQQTSDATKEAKDNLLKKVIGLQAKLQYKKPHQEQIRFNTAYGKDDFEHLFSTIKNPHDGQP